MALSKQDYLQRKVADQADVSIYLHSGVQLKGKLTGYDRDEKVLFLEPDVMVFESNIATVVGKSRTPS